MTCVPWRYEQIRPKKGLRTALRVVLGSLGFLLCSFTVQSTTSGLCFRKTIFKVYGGCVGKSEEMKKDD